MAEKMSSTKPPRIRQSRIQDDEGRGNKSHEQSWGQANRKDNGNKAATINSTANSVGCSSMTKNNDLFTASVASSNKCLDEETVTPQRGYILRDNTAATISFSSDSGSRGGGLSSLSKTKEEKQCLPDDCVLNRTQSTKRRKRKQFTTCSSKLKPKQQHLQPNPSTTVSQKKCNRKRRHYRAIAEKPSHQHHVKSPLQAAQDCIIKLETNGGGRDREWGPATREIIRNSNHVKPPPCPICGNEDVRTVTQLYEVGWSCIDCGEEYSYPHLTSFSPNNLRGGGVSPKTFPGDKMIKIPPISIGPAALKRKITRQ
mmetsp:Transcript_31104/g.50531  ORF Transcript_31104/g.50531 Transcript_31104/m.50531 type:complete len:313 (-) Transcript_31104:238-1176(-)